jgi:hypothetical protein
MSNTTRKHPRTLQQAFGPYTDNRIEPSSDEARHRLCDLVIAIIAVGTLAAIVIGRSI